MPYKIKHKSYNECLIQYTRDKGVRRKKRFDLSLVVFAVIALMIGIDFIVVIIGFLIVSAVLKKGQPLPSNYEIELNRRDNRISVRRSGQAQPKTKTYPLDKFKGFGFRERSSNRNSNHLAQADLFFRFDPSKGLSRQVAIRKYSHPVPLSNAVKIIDATDDWLENTDDTAGIEDPQQAPEIFRDFRDMEKSEFKPD